MCDQTKIDYLDGDVVWVKLSSCWWPGQVVGLDNLEEEIRKEFENKPLIAAVKFFDEKTYEYIKNYHHIYKYNCSQKDEFIKKGLDKYRAKVKDGLTYMNKFPEDVRTAEKMTDGNPDILSDKKFMREEKPDIASLFGSTKKLPKKKRHSEGGRKSNWGEEGRKITPRAHKIKYEMKHRELPSDLPLLPHSAVNTHYPCPYCDYTTTRVNVIMYHWKIHKIQGGITKSFKGKQISHSTPKKKYIRKEKSLVKKNKGEGTSEILKRKQKEIEKVNKKPKMDSTVTDLIADWDDSRSNDKLDDMMELPSSETMATTFNLSDLNASATDDAMDVSIQSESIKELAKDSDSILEETEKLLKNAEKLTEIVSVSKSTSVSKYTIKSPTISDERKSEKYSLKDKLNLTGKTEGKQSDEDKRSRLSCFDFDEEDPEPTIPHVRKIPRSSGMPLKKEIIKEFEMSQALKNEKEKKNLEANLNKPVKETFHDKLKIFSFRSRHSESLDDSSLSKDLSVTDEVPSFKNDTSIEKKDTASIDDETVSKNDSPLKRDFSPIKRDLSPEKKDVSPVKKDLSLIKADLSPVKKDLSPVKKDISPFKKDISPLKKDISPLKKDVSPFKKDSSPFAKDSSPFAKDSSPFRKDTSPVKETNLIKVDASPVKRDLSPMKKETIKMDDFRVKKNLSPMKGDTTPVKKDKSPLKRDISPVNRDRSPIKEDLSSAKKDSSPLKLNLFPAKKDLLPDEIKKQESLTKKPTSTIEENVEILEILEFETEEDNVNFRKDTDQKTQPVMGFHIDKEELRPFLDQTFSQDDEMLTESGNLQKIDNEATDSSIKDTLSLNESTLSEEVDTELEEPKEKPVEVAKKRRGRPRKHPLPEGLDNSENLTAQVQEQVELESKQSESDSDRSLFSGRRRKPNKKYYMNFESDSCISSPEHRSIKTDDSQSDTEEKFMEEKKVVKGKRGRRPKSYYLQLEAEKQKQEAITTESIEKKSEPVTEISVEKTDIEAENIDSQNHEYDSLQTSQVVTDTFETTDKLKFDVDLKEDKLPTTITETTIQKIITNHSDQNEHQQINEVPKPTQIDIQKNLEVVDMLPPKKSQIKKFEQSQLDALENKTVDNDSRTVIEEKPKEIETKAEKMIIEEEPNIKQELYLDNNVPISTIPQSGDVIKTKDQLDLDTKKTPTVNDNVEQKQSVTTTEAPIEIKKDKPENVLEKKIMDSTENEKVQKSPAKTRHKSNYLPNYPYKPKREFIEENVANSYQEAFLKTMQIDPNDIKKQSKEATLVPAVSEKNISENLNEPKTVQAVNVSCGNVAHVESSPIVETKTTLLSIDTQKLEDSSTPSPSPSPSSDVSVPVKKREKPRIIENVALKEPLILKSQLLEKSCKNLKHKLEGESARKVKMMKLDSLKTKSSSKKVTLVPTTKKVQIRKMMESVEEPAQTSTAQPTLVQQGSLEGMDIDINNIPFVLSDDILTPENIEQMPVVISSVPLETTSMPQSSNPASALPTTPLKKKSETPAILKSKNKGKPTITSIHTIVPPFGGVKGINLQGTPSPKTSKIVNQEGNNNASKYFLVQTVQGKLSHAQKIPMQVIKSSSNPQVVHREGRVVILTSSASDQKVVPFSVAKGGKVQRIVPNKSQVCNTLSSQSVTTSKTITAVKGDISLPTTSKVSPGQKILIRGKSSSVFGTMIQGTMKSGVLTSLSSPKSKTILATQPGAGKSPLSTIDRRITTSKGTVLTPISSQEIKAMTAAKSPSKAGQKVQKIVQIPMLQKVQKIPTATQVSLSAGINPTSAIVYKNSPGMLGKKIKQQMIVQSSPPAVTNSNSAQSISTLSSGKHKTKIVTSAQKVSFVKGKHSKVSQSAPKIVQSKSTAMEDINDLSPVITKSKQSKQKNTTSSQKSVVRSTAAKPEQKNLLNIALSSALGANYDIAAEQSTLEAPRVTENKMEVQNVSIEETKTEATQQQSEKADDIKYIPGQIYAVPMEGPDLYAVYIGDEHGNLNRLDNNTTLLIDDSGEATSNLVLHAAPGNGDLSTASINETETSQRTSSEIGPTGNQDILAAALANTDFQQDLETPAVTLTSTGLMNQTIMQSTIIPTTEPITLSSVLETSLTLNQPIMTPLEVPSNMPIQSETMSNVPSVTTMPPSSLELPITITDPNISYIAAGETQLQISGSSMPEISDVINTGGAVATVVETSQVETPSSTQYIVIPNLEENIVLEQIQTVEQQIPTVSYSVSIPENIIMEAPQIHATPSMPIIDDGYADNFTESVETSTVDASFADVPVSEMLISKANVPVTDTVTDVVAPSDTTITTGTTEVTVESSVENLKEETIDTVDAVVISEETIESTPVESLQQEEQRKEMLQKEKSEEAIQEKFVNEVTQEEKHDEQSIMQVDELMEERCVISSESNAESQSWDQVPVELMDTSETETCQAAETTSKTLNDETDVAIEESSISVNEAEVTKKEEPHDEAATSNEPCQLADEPMEVDEPMGVDETDKGLGQVSTNDQTDEVECMNAAVDNSESAIKYDETETSQEAPSQSYERVEVPSQSAKSENSREPTQSFEDANAPTQSYNEILESRIPTSEDGMDDPSFPTQSYEVEKTDNLSENLDTDPELSQEGNVPSQSNDDAIGTSLITNSLGLNEDETASSSYVPETPETQERDQDQESAISTSSYEIAPCEELNIASSSVIPDTSVQSEHLSIHDNGVPEIPTSSYNLNPDSSSTHRDAVPTSSYEDQVIIEQNVSTSYGLSISMPGLEDATSQNFVTESTDQRNVPSSYYLHHREISASCYNPTTHEETLDSQLKSTDPQEEVSASYYEGAPRNEASQSYFTTEEATPSYCGQNLTSDYYDPRTDTEATQSFYSGSERSSLQNVEASQSFYQEGSTSSAAEQRDGEATPASYPERYQMDYAPADSPIDRHDLVESSSTRQR